MDLYGSVSFVMKLQIMTHKNLACKLQFAEELNASITTVIDLFRSHGINSPIYQDYVSGMTIFTMTNETELLETIFNHVPQHQKFAVSFSRVTRHNKDNNLIALPPDANMRLKCFQSELYNALTRGYPKRGLKLKEKFNPELWTPHCPIAQFISQYDFEMVTNIFPLINFPIVGIVDQIVVVDLSTNRNLFRHPLLVVKLFLFSYFAMFRF